MATEYIKREDAITAIRKSPISNTGTYLFCLDAIDDIPAADVVERKHGVWLTGLVKDSDGSVRRTFSFCSVCNLLVEKETNYCPNCGAEMGEDIPMEYFESGGK